MKDSLKIELMYMNLTMLRSSSSVGFQPILTFVSIVILGIIIVQYVITLPAWRIPIILLSILIGGLIAALELRAIVKSRQRVIRNHKEIISDENANLKLAKYVAELFDENIPYEDLERKEDKTI